MRTHKLRLEHLRSEYAAYMRAAIETRRTALPTDDCLDWAKVYALAIHDQRRWGKWKEQR